MSATVHHEPSARAERIYRISVKRGRVAAIGTPPRQPTARSDRVTWDIPEPELADVPLVRDWLREHNVAEGPIA
jgi:hypothetical protein